jgi:hypothetical protein
MILQQGRSGEGSVVGCPSDPVVTDHLGSISVATDENGNVVERLSYDAWGKRRFANGTDDVMSYRHPPMAHNGRYF